MTIKKSTVKTEAELRKEIMAELAIEQEAIAQENARQVAREQEARVAAICATKGSRKEKVAGLSALGLSSEKISTLVSVSAMQGTNAAIRKGVEGRDFPSFSGDPKARKEQFSTYLRRNGATERQIAKDSQFAKQWTEGVDNCLLAYKLGKEDAKATAT